MLGLGADTVNAFPADEVVELGSGLNETVYGGTGDTIEASGGAALVTFESGSQGIVFAETAGADQLYSGPGDTLLIGAGVMNVIGAAGNTLVLGSGTDTVNALPPNEAVTLGSGNATVFGGDGDTIGDAAGTVVVLTGGNSAIVVEAAGGAVTVADGAGDTIAAGNAAATVVGAKNSAIVLGAAADTVTGANGDTITAGSGAASIDFLSAASQTFVDASSLYNDTIVGFSQSNADRIHLTTDTVSDALAHSTQVDGGQDTLIALSDGSTILLKGITSINSSFFS
jgi:Ca2+-binding RTX toxin-like protein